MSGTVYNYSINWNKSTILPVNGDGWNAASQNPSIPLTTGNITLHYLGIHISAKLSELLLRLLHSITEGGGRSEGPDAQCKGKHKVYYKTKEQQQYMKTQINTRHQTSKETKLGGYPSGRPPLWQATPSGRQHPLAGYTLCQATQNKKGKLNYTVTQDKANIRHANITQGNKLGGYPSGRLPHW